MAKLKKQLILQHNTHSLALYDRISDKNGHIPSPSLAYTSNEDPLLNFGTMTLLFEPTLINFSKHMTHNADIFTARMGDVKFKVKRGAIKAIESRFDDAVAHYKIPSGSYLNLNMSGLIDLGFQKSKYNIISHDGMRLAFLKEHSVPVRLPMIDHECPLDFLKPKHIKAMVKDGLFLESESAAKKKIIEHDAYRSAIREDLERDGEFSQEDFDSFYELFQSNGKLNGRLYFELKHYVTNNLDKEKKLDGTKLREIMDAKINKNKKTADKFERWCEEIIESACGNPFVMDEDNREVKATATAISKIIDRQAKGSEGFGYSGVGKLRALLSSRISSISDVVNYANLLVSRDDFDKAKDDIDKKFDEIASSIAEYRKPEIELLYSSDSEFLAGEIEDGLKSGSSKKAVINILSDAFLIDDIPEELLEDISNLLNHLKSMETEYFECKYRGVLNFDKIAMIVAPKNISRQDAEIISKYDIPVSYYSVHNCSKKTKQSRIEAIQKAVIKNQLGFGDLGETKVGRREVAFEL